MQFDVFLSHRWADLEKVLSLARALEGRGINPWLAAEQDVAPDVWRHEVIDVLRRLPAVALVSGHKPPGEWGERDLPSLRADCDA